MQVSTAHHHARKRFEAGKTMPTSPLARFIDLAIYPVGIAALLMALPQVYEVWVNQNVVGVSIATWGLWTIFSLFWILYGYVHKNWLIFGMNIGWFFLQGVITLGVYLHSHP
ncbi:MAG: hypothetical protein KBD05_01645 [Candidatus Pacebacteria bacterium]|nr:hypothetical protein [Candidatus Paceibacterota bacterium]